MTVSKEEILEIPLQLDREGAALAHHKTDKTGLLDTEEREYN